MPTDEDVRAIKDRMREWAGLLVERKAFPLLLVYVGPDGELRFLTTAPPGTVQVAEALERAAAAIRIESN
jgi:hypothetical protein